MGRHLKCNLYHPFFNIIAMEVLLSKLPQSESGKHVGAWSPWAATGLIIAAALLSKGPKNSFRRMFGSSIQGLKRISGWINTMVITVRTFVTRNKHSKQRQPAPNEPKFIDNVDVAKLNWSRVHSTNVKRVLISYRDTITDDWKSLVAFWRDPDCAEIPLV